MSILRALFRASKRRNCRANSTACETEKKNFPQKKKNDPRAHGAISGFPPRYIFQFSPYFYPPLV